MDSDKQTDDLKCMKCKEMKPTTAFSLYRTSARGYQRVCKACMSQANKELRKRPGFKERKNAMAREWHRKIPDRRRRSQLKYAYGITLEQYESMYWDQLGRCGICEELPKAGIYLEVDHCHETTRVRGLLCSQCNVGLGHFKDSIKIMGRAIGYLGSVQ